MTEFRCVITELYWGFKSLAGVVTWWERLVTDKKTSHGKFDSFSLKITLGNFQLAFLNRSVLSSFFIDLRLDVPAFSIDSDSSLSYLADIEIKLSKDRLLLHLIDSLLSAFKGLNFLFVFLKLLLLIQLDVEISTSLFFRITSLKADLNLKHTYTLK